jgi:hypothetical protein
MSEAYFSECTNGAIRSDGRREEGLGAGHWLGLAAAPTFAIMALISWTQGGGMPDMLCVAMHDPSPLTGMVPMYVLMSAFHLGPWLKLIANGRADS